MFYILVRIVILIAIVIIAFKLFKNKVCKKTHKFIVIFSLSFCVLLSAFPIENCFINFNSAKSIQQYYASGNYIDSVYGNSSYMVIYSTGSNTTSHFIGKKSTKGYKIPNYLGYKKVYNSFVSNGHITIYKARGTNDYYLLGTIFLQEDEIEIRDSNNLLMKSIVYQNGDTNNNLAVFYGFTNDIYDNYSLRVNEKELFRIE